MAGLHLTLDPTGISLQRAPDQPGRRLRWTEVTATTAEPWTGDDRRPGALVTVSTAVARFRFGIPGGDVATLRYVLDELAGFARGRSAGAGTPHASLAGQPSGSPGTASTRLVGARGQHRSLGGSPRPRRAVVAARTVAIALVLALAVALVLAQSAGAIHLPFLGSSSGGTHTAGALSPLAQPWTSAG